MQPLIGKFRKSKGVPKLYSWHAPEAELFAKGKAKTPYELGVKVGITSTLKGNFIFGAGFRRIIDAKPIIKSLCST